VTGKSRSGEPHRRSNWGATEKRSKGPAQGSAGSPKQKKKKKNVGGGGRSKAPLWGGEKKGKDRRDGRSQKINSLSAFRGENVKEEAPKKRGATDASQKMTGG